MGDFAMASALWGQCRKAVPQKGESLFGAYWNAGTAALGITATADEIPRLLAKYPDFAEATRDERGKLVKA